MTHLNLVEGKHTDFWLHRTKMGSWHLKHILWSMCWWSEWQLRGQEKCPQRSMCWHIYSSAVALCMPTHTYYGVQLALHCHLLQSLPVSTQVPFWHSAVDEPVDPVEQTYLHT